jgi:hypothetical protein
MVLLYEIWTEHSVMYSGMYGRQADNRSDNTTRSAI